MNEQLKKLIQIVKKTGDRLIVFDPENQSFPYVIMSLEEYEKMFDRASGKKSLTEEVLVDKINRDIAGLKNDGDFPDFADNLQEEEIKKMYENALNAGNASVDVQTKKKNNWQIPAERKTSATGQ